MQLVQTMQWLRLFFLFFLFSTFLRWDFIYQNFIYRSQILFIIFIVLVILNRQFLYLQNFKLIKINELIAAKWILLLANVNIQKRCDILMNEKLNIYKEIFVFERLKTRGMNIPSID